MRRPVAVVAGALLLAWFVVPLLPVLLWAGADRWTVPGVLPQDWGGRGWADAADAGLPAALARSALLGLVVAVVATPLGVAAGRALGWRTARHPRLLVAVLLLPILLPPFAVSMGLDVVLLRLGIPAPVAVVGVLAVFALPYAAATCAAGWARVDPGVEEQARALGATARQARWRTGLPAVRGSIAVAALLAFLVGWSDYVVTLLLGGGRLVTAPVLLGAAASGSGNEPAVAAVAVATVLPPLLLVGLLAASGALRRRRLLAAAPAGAVP